MVARRLPTLVDSGFTGSELIAVHCAAYFFPLKWSMTASMKLPTEQMSSIRLKNSDQSKNSIRVTSFLRGEESRHIELPAAQTISYVQNFFNRKFLACALPNRAV